jgi:glycine reductase
MDLQSQEAILRASQTHDKADLVVLLGSPDPESATIAAETVVEGDPSYAGALAGAQLGLTTYHILEDVVHADIPDDVWEAQIGVMADVLEADALAETVAGFRTYPHLAAVPRAGAANCSQNRGRGPD